MTKVLRDHFVTLPDPVVNEPVADFVVSITGQGEMIRQHLSFDLMLAPQRIEMPDSIGNNLVGLRVLDKHQVLGQIIVHIILELDQGVLKRVGRQPLGKYCSEGLVLCPCLELQSCHSFQVVRIGGNHHKSRHPDVCCNISMQARLQHSCSESSTGVGTLVTK